VVRVDLGGRRAAVLVAHLRVAAHPLKALRVEVVVPGDLVAKVDRVGRADSVLRQNL
jgi:hypothetical protein